MKYYYSALYYTADGAESESGTIYAESAWDARAYVETQHPHADHINIYPL